MFDDEGEESMEKKEKREVFEAKSQLELARVYNIVRKEEDTYFLTEKFKSCLFSSRCFLTEKLEGRVYPLGSSIDEERKAIIYSKLALKALKKFFTGKFEGFNRHTKLRLGQAVMNFLKALEDKGKGEIIKVS